MPGWFATAPPPRDRGCYQCYDFRVEYQEPDGRWEREDIEVVTPHYRGAHGASVARAGFSCYRGLSVRLSTSGAGRGGGRNGGLAEELWR